MEMLIWFLFLRTALSTNEFSDRDFGHVDFQNPIVPSGWSPPKIYNDITVSNSPYSVIDEAHHQKLKLFIQYVEKGYTNDALTFNIYDDNMRDATISLFRLLQDLKDEDQFKWIINWISPWINKDMFEYVHNLLWLYTSRIDNADLHLPYTNRPNLFVNSETIIKAYQLRKPEIDYLFTMEKAHVNGIITEAGGIAINTNYSGWNLRDNGCEEELNYFREDVQLNSYYYALNLIHPYWMANDELSVIYPRHAEHYYFVHQQLMARYNLEKEHLKQKKLLKEEKCLSGYNPYLIYKNGLNVPVRQPLTNAWSEERAKLKSIDIAINECISRGLIVLDNGTVINMTAENHIDLVAKLVRANLDGIKTAKIVRSVYGYGGNPPISKGYNPAPSLWHNPETSLRDPLYWNMVQTLLNYFSDYKNIIEPNNRSTYQTDEINIIDHNFTKITTKFEYFNLKLNQFLGYEPQVSIMARQRRLAHVPFTLNFTVDSKVSKDVRVRLFLGPQCSVIDCWKQYTSFYQLHNYRYTIKKGLNTLTFSPENFEKNHNECDDILEKNSLIKNKRKLFSFPRQLIIPKGLEEGLNLTLFVMITPLKDNQESNYLESKINYSKLNNYDIEYPLGVPFHGQTVATDDYFNNYKFYNISVYHSNSLPDITGHYSPHLY